ncbi:hypothetical protein J6590_086001 [Homalodisca vitripennis]|nr:hypothetical protein J6590_086001 [Homalodisca vitripennis]
MKACCLLRGSKTPTTSYEAQYYLGTSIHLRVCQVWNGIAQQHIAAHVGLLYVEGSITSVHRLICESVRCETGWPSNTSLLILACCLLRGGKLQIQDIRHSITSVHRLICESVSITSIHRLICESVRCGTGSPSKTSLLMLTCCMLRGGKTSTTSYEAQYYLGTSTHLRVCQVWNRIAQQHITAHYYLGTSTHLRVCHGVEQDRPATHHCSCWPAVCLGEVKLQLQDIKHSITSVHRLICESVRCGTGSPSNTSPLMLTCCLLRGGKTPTTSYEAQYYLGTSTHLRVCQVWNRIAQQHIAAHVDLLSVEGSITSVHRLICESVRCGTGSPSNTSPLMLTCCLLRGGKTPTTSITSVHRLICESVRCGTGSPSNTSPLMLTCCMLRGGKTPTTSYEAQYYLGTSTHLRVCQVWNRIAQQHIAAHVGLLSVEGRSPVTQAKDTNKVAVVRC